MRFVFLLLHHRRVHLKSVLLSLYTHSMYIDRHATPQNCAHSRSYFLLNSFHLSLTQFSDNDDDENYSAERRNKNLFSITLNCDTLNVVVVVEEGGKSQITLMEKKHQISPTK